ncbi:TPA: hypothetical protein UZ441_004717 [Escherichia coli]|nr:hypothetical protein [Escherichia coli]HEL8025824.1 hypothetical protein [Escherichia coli]HEL8044614.1 hypothetical protein [Escherichia coli]HEL8049359.1 hypothetical protein [Escherichia coli]HEL8054131.1 hypothetical protein [Escherichia coli]
MGVLQPAEVSDIRLVRDTIRTLAQRVSEGYTLGLGQDGAGTLSQYSRSGKSDPSKADTQDAKQFASDVSIPVGDSELLLFHRTTSVAG